MSVHGRSARRRLLIVTLAVPVVVAVYLTALLGRVAALPRLFIVALLGAPVIGSVYIEEAYRRAPDGVRRALAAMPAPRVSPLKAAAVMGLTVALLATSAPTAPVSAAKPAEAMIQAARAYLGSPYVFGAEGPNRFDCSGLIFRAFADIGQLQRIGGGRAKAVTYMRWFVARGMASKNDGQRGDLVVWGDGKHIGIYLGKGKVISALEDQGVAVHGLHAISLKFTTFLKVSWKGRAGNGGVAGGRDEPDPKKDKNKNNDGRATDVPTEPSDVTSGDVETARGVATGTLNLRRGHDPSERVIGWVSKGSRFTITGTGHSPSGALWYSVEMDNGKSGWVYSRWVNPLGE